MYVKFICYQKTQKSIYELKIDIVKNVSSYACGLSYSPILEAQLLELYGFSEKSLSLPQSK